MQLGVEILKAQVNTELPSIFVKNIPGGVELRGCIRRIKNDVRLGKQALIVQAGQSLDWPGEKVIA